MSTPINHASENTIRTWQAERQLEDYYRARWAAHRGTVPADPTEHAGSGNGAPVAWLLLAILFALGLALGWLVWNWMQAGM